MCGLCGVIRPAGPTASDQALVAELNLRQRHRGPDDAVGWQSNGATLGHTRLAIVDLTANGRQPFVSADGSVAVVFNGEIYNHDKLRRQYRLPVTGRCDGAILPDLWRRLGTSTFAALRGMYAIAVYDARRRTVTLARDPFGIKPLYWAQLADGGLVFASELRCLLPLVPAGRLRTDALRHYLRFGAIGRDQSPFEGVEAVPANGWVQWGLSSGHRRGTIRKLFEPAPGIVSGGLRAALLESVSAHLASDVPVALLLSSGLDSAAIAWACGELAASLTCVTVDMGLGTSERAGAARVAARFGHRHEVISAAPDPGMVQHYFAAMQRPSIDGLNTFLVSKAIAETGTKVALSGLGGDEVLAGYRAFRYLRCLPLLRATDAVSLGPVLSRLCSGRKPKLARLLDRGGPRDAAGLAALFRQVLTEDQVTALTGGKPCASTHDPAPAGTSARALSLAELTGYLGGTLLPDTDTFSMTWSVELRVPYVDLPFIGAALAVAGRFGVGKRGFAAALGDPELSRIARRGKRGFTLPMDQWMRDGPLAVVVTNTRSPDAPVRRLLRGEVIDRLLTGWCEGRLSWSRAWLVVSLDAWLRSFESELTVAGGDHDAVRIRTR
jgi:asparagine synthase (glutamine-hydrolysing)